MMNKPAGKATQAQIIDLLNDLSQCQAAIDLYQMRYDEQRRQIIPPEIQKQLDDLSSEIEGKKEIAQGKIEALRAKIKETFFQLPDDQRETINGEFLQVQYRKGSIKWDDNGLIGLSKVVPGIMDLRTQAEPTIAIATRRGK